MPVANLFEHVEQSQTKNCVRCNIRCRVVPQVDPNADLFVVGTMRTGRYCANCLVVDFFKNCAIGPSSAMGDWYFDSTKPIPDWQTTTKRFDPESFRLPHVRKQFTAMLESAEREMGAQLRIADVDWDEVIANWHLPFPERAKRKGKKKTDATEPKGDDDAN